MCSTHPVCSHATLRTLHLQRLVLSRHPTTTAFVKIDLQKRGTERTGGWHKKRDIRLHKKRLRPRQKYVVVSPPPPPQSGRTLIELITMESWTEGRDGRAERGRTKKEQSKREGERDPHGPVNGHSAAVIYSSSGCAKCPLALTEPAAEATCAADRPAKVYVYLIGGGAAACVRHRN